MPAAILPDSKRLRCLAVAGLLYAPLLGLAVEGAPQSNGTDVSSGDSDADRRAAEQQSVRKPDGPARADPVRPDRVDEDAKPPRSSLETAKPRVLAETTDPESTWAGMLLSKRYWQSVKWEQFENERIVASLPAVLGSDGRRPDSEKVTKRAANGVFAGIRARAALVKKERAKSKFKFGFEASSDVDAMDGIGEAKCASMLDQFERSFGPPKVRVETSAPSARAFRKRAQWDIGRARLSFFCLAFEFNMVPTGDDRMLVWLFEARNVEEAEHYTPLTWIRCTRKMTLRINGEVRKTGDMEDKVFAIDDYAKGDLLDADLKSWGSPEVTRATITRKHAEGPKSWHTTINRTTGDFSEVVVLKDENAEGLITGQCTKFDPSSTKF